MSAVETRPASGSPPSRPASVCLFCGSASGRDPRYVALAESFGAACARANVRLVFGGGGVGLMGAAARAATAGGGAVLGIIPEFLRTPEIAYEDAPLEVVSDLHARKRRMAEEADGFVVLPGGVGTLEEAVEVLSWARLELYAQPVVFLDDDGFWDPFFHLIAHQTEAGFTPASLRRTLRRARSAQEALGLALAPNLVGRG